MGGPGRRVLLVLTHSGHLRLMDGLIAALIARGARVELAFSSPRHKPEFGPPRFDPPPPRGLTVHLDPIPRPVGGWAAFARALRRTGDFLRYLDPAYRAAPHLRQRMAARLPAPMAWLSRMPALPRPLLAPLRAAVGLMEHLVPTSPRVDGFLAEAAPDLVLVSPLVDPDSAQADLVKSARAMGLPTAACIGSWDHLTTKGQMHVRPHRTFVWNGAQRREAVAWHGLGEDEVEVVGATAFDKWFGRAPTGGREALCARLGLPADRPFVLYACSASQICEAGAEAEFVEAWLAALRRHPRLSRLGAVIRPHPLNAAGWREADPARFPGAAVHPRTGANPNDAADRAEYFDTLHHCAAVVGINTSALVEAAVVGRPPLTVLSERFNQLSTLHFRHLLPEGGGCLTVARDLDEHLVQLAAAIDDPSAQAGRLERFVDGFVRPRGRDRPASDLLAEAALRLARPAPRPGPLLFPLGEAFGRRPAVG